jgi:hypothetical protein
MSTAEEVYEQNVRPLPPEERRRVAELILAEMETREETDLPRRSMAELLGSLPPGPRSAASWEELERQLQEGRNSWDR